MDPSAANGSLPALGALLPGTPRGDSAAPVSRDPRAGGFAALLGPGPQDEAWSPADGSVLPSAGGSLPVTALVRLTGTQAVASGLANGPGQAVPAAPADGPGPALSGGLDVIVSGAAPARQPLDLAVAAAAHGGGTGRSSSDSGAANLAGGARKDMLTGPAVTKPDTAGNAVRDAQVHAISETGRRDGVLSQIHHFVTATGPARLSDVAVRPLLEQAAARTAPLRHDAHQSPTVEGRTVRPASGVTPLAVTAGLESVARSNPDATSLNVTTGLTEQTESPDTQFDSIRVIVREPAADRPAAGRSQALELPAPRLPVGHPEWGRALAERLVVMVRGDHQVARLSLNPEHLGPVDIKLHIADDQARLWFTAQHPQAREALEAAVPRLREMFAQQGLDLSQGMGRDDGPRHDRGEAPAHSASASYRPHDDGFESQTGAGRDAAAPNRRGLIDHYA